MTFMYVYPTSSKMVIIMANSLDEAIRKYSLMLDSFDETLIQQKDSIIIQTGIITCSICDTGWTGHCECSAKMCITN